MLKTVDIFKRPEGQAFDLTNGVDIVDFFNAGMAEPMNKIEQAFNPLEIEAISSESTADEDLQRSRERRQSQKSMFAENDQVETPQFGFQQQKVNSDIFNDELADEPNYNVNTDLDDSFNTPDGSFDPASFTFNREARRDSQGRLSVYNPPSGDGGGAFEVAGITARYQRKEATRLKNLISQGKHSQAEAEAKRFFRKRASPFVKHASQKGLQLQLADTVHHRGEGGLRNILQMATGSKTKSYSSLIKRLDSDPKALAKFNRARIQYERDKVDRGRSSRQKFRKGLMSRFNQANSAAIQANQS